MTLLQIARTDQAVSLQGEIDMAVADEVTAALLQGVEAGIPVVDMSEVTFIDSSGLRALLSVAQTLNGSGPLVLRRPSPAVTRILRIALPNGGPGLEVSA